MHEGPRCSNQGLIGPLDQLLSTLHQYLDGHVVGNQIPFDDLTLEIEVGLRRRGEADLDLLEADLDERLEEGELALRIHRVDEGLVTVTQVDTGPPRRPVKLAIGT